MVTPGTAGTVVGAIVVMVGRAPGAGTVGKAPRATVGKAVGIAVRNNEVKTRHTGLLHFLTAQGV